MLATTQLRTGRVSLHLNDLVKAKRSEVGVRAMEEGWAYRMISDLVTRTRNAPVTCTRGMSLWELANRRELGGELKMGYM